MRFEKIFLLAIVIVLSINFILAQADSCDSKSAFFVYTQKGDFDKSLNEIIGTNHDLANTNFKQTNFKIFVDERMLSMINYQNKKSYEESDISFNQDVDNSAQIISITRHTAEEDGTCRSPTVPDSVFAGNIINKASMQSSGNFFDLSSQSGDIYIFRDEKRERWATSGQSCSPSIHSSRLQSLGKTNIADTPTFLGYPFTDDGYLNTYGSGAYVYVDDSGELRFKAYTQRQESRIVFAIGIMLDECNPQCSDGIDNDKDGFTDFSGVNEKIIKNTKDDSTINDFITQTQATKLESTSDYIYNTKTTDLGQGVVASTIGLESLGTIGFHLNDPKFTSKTSKRLGMSGSENFDINFDSDTYSFAWKMYEPLVAPDTGTSGGHPNYVAGVDSTYSVVFKKDNTEVKRLSINSKDYTTAGDENMFFGVWLKQSFNKVEFRESGVGSNEWFGPFYVGDSPPTSGDPDCDSPEDNSESPESTGCPDDITCSEPTPFCKEDTGVCVECLENSDCDDGISTTQDTCTNNHCSHSTITELYWANMEKTLIVEADIGDTVLMIGKDTGLSEGTAVTFEIYEDDPGILLLNPDDAIRTGDDVITGVVKNGKAIGKWRITQEDLDRVGDGINEIFEGDEKFIFKIGSSKSSALRIDTNPHNSQPSTEIISPEQGTKYSISSVTTKTQSIDFNQVSSDVDDDLKITWMFGDNTEEETLNCLTTNTCNTTHQYSNSGTKTIYLQTQEMPPRTQTVYDRARVYVYKLGYNVFAEINNPNAISLDPGIHTLEGTNSYAAQCFDTSEACSGTCYQSGDLTCKDIESPTLTYEWIVNSEVETNKTSSINRVFIQPGTQNITLKVGYTPAGSTQIFDEDKIFFFIGRGGAFCSSTTSGSEWMDYSDNTLQTFDSLNDCFGTNSGIGTVIGRTDCCPLGRYSCSQVGECELTAEELCEDFTDEESCINSTSLAIRELTDAGEFCGITEESSEGGVLTFEEIECLCIWENNECKAVQESKRYNFNDITHPTDGGSCTWDNTEWTEDCDISNKITATWKAILTPNSEGYVSEELKDTCVDNSKEISCEGIVKLNFFTTINLIITLLSIITIYSFMFSKE